MKAFQIVLIMCVAGGLLIYALSAYFLHKNIEDQQATISYLKALPTPAGATFEGEQTTGYPDSIPTVEVIYTTKGNADAVLDYYKAKGKELNWTIIKETNDTTYATTPRILEFKTPNFRKPIQLIIENITTERSSKITIQVLL